MRKHLQGRGHPPALLFLAPWFACVALSSGSTAAAQTPPSALSVPKGFDSQGPVAFRMDALTANLKGHTVQGSGNAVVRQLPWMLCCDQFAAHTDAAGLWQKLKCVGRVRGYVSGRRLWAREAVYCPMDHTLTLTGAPRLTQGEGFLSGTKMVVQTERQEVRVVRPRGAMAPGALQDDGVKDRTLPLPPFMTGTLPDVCPWPWDAAPPPP